MGVSDKSKEAKLLEELKENGDVYFRAGAWNNVGDVALTITTVMASLAATVLAAAGLQGQSRWLVPAVAAIPAATATIQKTVRLRDRSNWYFICAARLRSLATRLEYGSSVLEEIADKRAELEVEMEMQWTKIGSSESSGDVHHPTNPSGESGKGSARKRHDAAENLH